ncbi:hypothetical protein [Corynebacterium propinquum]
MGKLTGNAIRVSTPNVSMTVLNLELRGPLGLLVRLRATNVGVIAVGGATLFLHDRRLRRNTLQQAA